MFNITPNQPTDSNSTQPQYIMSKEENSIIMSLSISNTFLESAKTDLTREYWQEKINTLMKEYKEFILKRCLPNQ